MATHKDAEKRTRQAEKARIRNRTYRSKLRGQTRTFREALAKGNLEAAKVEFSKAVSVIQSVATKGVIHKNQAARRVARLHAALKKATAPAAK